VLSLYTVVTVLAVLVFFMVNRHGATLVVSAPTAATGEAGLHQVSLVFQFLLALATIVIIARGVGALFRALGQPTVIGEIAGGLMLGPSLLGQVAPGAVHLLLPSSVLPFLSLHANLGIVLYMFLVGLELDLGVLRRNTQTTIAISHASIVVPLTLGVAMALWLYPTLSSAAVPFRLFALFFGVSLSITAFPVLARILADQHISQSRMGTIALACAAVDDATAWCLLALVVSVAQERLSDVVSTVALTVVFVFAVLLFVAPIIARIIPRFEKSSDVGRSALTLVLAAGLLSAMVTEYIGIHGLFGAFLLGAVIPRDTRVAAEVRRRLDDTVAVLFLPVFFAFTGLRTEVGLLTSVNDWMVCLAIIAAACAGKFGGTAIAGRVVGLPWNDAAALGVLMNTRGLVELIVLNIGLDLGVLSPKLFTMLVLMALVTTVMTTPLLKRFLRVRPWVVVRSEVS
jgi:Kef-type K+ transport system membrane component KefB